MHQVCEHCGQNHPDNPRFCPNSGKPLAGQAAIYVPDEAPTENAPPQLPSVRNNGCVSKLGYLAIILVTVIFIIKLVVWNHTPQPGTSTEGDSNAVTQGDSNAVAKDAPIILPPVETRFIQIVSTAQADSQRTANDMQKGGVKATRDKALCSTISSYEVSDWIGTVQTVDSNSDGKGVLAISIAPDVLVKTWNNSLSDIGTNSLIEPGSPVFESASAMKPGQLVTFSGTFFPGHEGDCIHEGSLTLDGKLKSPEFIFRFSSVSTYDPNPRTVRAPEVSNTVPAQESTPTALPEATPTPVPLDDSNPTLAQPNLPQEPEPSPTVTKDPDFAIYRNDRYGYSIAFPKDFHVNKPPEDGDGINIVSADGKAFLFTSGSNNSGLSLDDYRNLATKKLNDLHINAAYYRQGTDWFVMSWVDQGALVYQKMFVGNGSENMFIFGYPASQRTFYDHKVALMEKSFRPGNIKESH